MIFYNKKNIEKWAFWQKKGMLLYCVINAGIVTVITVSLNLILKISLHSTASLWSSIAGVALGTFIGWSFFSIALWYENQRKYKAQIQ